MSDGHQVVIAVVVKVLPVLWKSTGKQLCDWINTFLLSLRTQSLALDHIELKYVYFVNVRDTTLENGALSVE